jgi:ribonuclease Z
MIEVIVLGSGAALPMRGQTNTSFLVRTGAVALLIDCGPAVLQQLAACGMTPGDVTHLFITHRHGDHALGYPLFVLWWIAERKGLDGFPLTLTGQTTWGSLEILLQHSFGEVAARAAHVPRHLFLDHEPYVLRLSEGLTMRTWPMEHSRFAPVAGLRLEIDGKVIAFTSDTAPCLNILPLARDADLLFHEAAYSSLLDPEIPDGHHGHSLARTAGRNAAAANVRRLALVHLSACYEGRQDRLIEEAREAFPGEVTAPGDGAVYTV